MFDHRQAFTAFALILSFSVFAQAPEIEWQRSFGGSNSDQAFSTQQTIEGGFIVAGSTRSTNGDVSGYNGGTFDYWVVKLDATGEMEWQKPLGGSNNDQGSYVRQTSDGGYVLVGFSFSDDGHVSGNNGLQDVWVVKIDGNGSPLWQASLGGSGFDIGHSIQQTADGGYIVAGESTSNDGDVSGNQGGADYWIVKLQDDGNIEWQRSFGGSGWDQAFSVRQTADGGYVVAGTSNSDDGDVTDAHGEEDIWVVKLDGNGNMQWQKSLGGSGNDSGHSIEQTNDGGYIVAGTSASSDGDVTGNQGGSDYWVVKLDEAGAIQWQQSLGGSEFEVLRSIEQTNDGGYIAAGTTSSNDGDVSGNHGDSNDYWITKLNENGVLLWQKCLGGGGFDVSHSVQQTNDGGYIVAGFSDSNDGDVTGNQGDLDFWVVKLFPDPTSVEEFDEGVGFSLHPNPTDNHVSISFTLKTAGKVQLRLFNSTGQLVMDGLDERLPAGEHSVPFTMAALPSGIYHVQLTMTDRTIARKVAKF